MKHQFFYITLLLFVSCSGNGQDETKIKQDAKTRTLDSLYSEQKLGELFVLTDSLLKQNPNDPAALAHRGYVSFHMNENERALQDINTAFDLGYDTGVLRAIRGTIYAGNKEYNNALEDFESYTKMGYAEFMVSRNRAVIYEDLDECIKAIPDYRYLMSLNDSLFMRYSIDVGDCFESHAMHDSAIVYYTYSVNEEPKVNNLNRRALSYQSLGAYKKALADYDKALNMTTKYDTLDRIILLSNKATVQADLGLLDSAIVSTNSAIEISKFPGETLLPNKASFLLDKGKPKEALKILMSLSENDKKRNLQLIEKCKKAL